MEKKRIFTTMWQVGFVAFFASRAAQFGVENIVATIAAGILLVGIFGHAICVQKEKTRKSSELENHDLAQ